MSVLKVNIHFSIPYTTSYGESLQIHLLDETGQAAVGGSTPIPMNWTDGHVWQVTKQFCFDRAAVRAQTAPFLYCFEVVKDGEVIRVDCPQMTKHHHLDAIAILGAQRRTPAAQNSLVISVKELWDFPDKQVVTVLDK